MSNLPKTFTVEVCGIETSLRRFDVELTDLIWDSGYGERDAVLNATVLWNCDGEEIVEIEDMYFGWVDQDGGDHEILRPDTDFCEKVITAYIKGVISSND